MLTGAAATPALIPEPTPPPFPTSALVSEQMDRNEMGDSRSDYSAFNGGEGGDG